ncbi:hypothetical protein [Lignipirellula cremea]|uniref:Uncharacterized protein n=1 Tax=Lignipirellula cremea TaxID=2528010 RepID=A0A518E3W8_9BACT|nr:hypothetical protein [Lignipirellula cremea]QDU96243.1 hypothetical protein Pla8534_40620 [Lignipirellula cremea]QDU98781.1 hypothetical protein Pla8534_66550 [Lignipirellula cremea]
MTDGSAMQPLWFPDWCEDVARNGFPTVQQLRRGILLGCIAQSFWLVKEEPVFELFWADDIYLDDQMGGERWAVAFSEAGAVAVFYSSESSRNPYPEGRPPYDQSWYFEGMPNRLEPAKRRALSYMLDLEFRLGGSNAVVTSAMWADTEAFTAVESWPEVFYHSCWACHQQLLPPEVALAEWWEGMELPESGIGAARSLYERRLASMDPEIFVEPREWQRYLEVIESTPDPRKIAAARELLAGVGIVLPENTNGGISH